MRCLRVIGLGVLMMVSVGAASKHPGARSKGMLLTVAKFPGPRPPDEQAVIRSQDVLVDTLLLRDPSTTRLSIPVFDKVLDVDLERRVVSAEGRLFWYGRVAGTARGEVTLSLNKQVMVGGISMSGGKVYQIRYLTGPYHRLQEIALSKLPSDTTSAAPLPPPPQPSVTCSTDPPTDIDVLVLYTPAARAAAGGVDAMEALIAGAIESTNQSYINSAIDQRLRLVHMQEEPYTESGDLVTDLQHLRDPADGVMDDVMPIRDSYGADLVALFTERVQPLGTCGHSTVMQTVSNSAESDAYSVLLRDCESGNYTFGHELGHLMGARHPWINDSTDNLPDHHDHGFVHSQTSWATMMAVSSSCTGCSRILYWSNPNITYGSDPTGTSSEPHPTDNASTLNQTALTVANFRCSAPAAADVWMKDTWDDTGAEPDPRTAGEDMWKSPYIWVRNAQDPAPHKQEHMHQNPIVGTTNWIYVKLHNGATTGMSGTLETYYADASISLTWPGGWVKIGEVPITDFPAKSTYVAEQKWDNVPGPGHFCLLARWVSPTDPMKFPEGSDISENVRNNNNLIWRNVNIVSLMTKSWEIDSLLVGNDSTSPESLSIGFRWPEGRRPSFLTYGAVSVRLDSTLAAAWRSGGNRSSGVHPDSYGFRINANGGQMDRIVLPPSTHGRLFVRMSRVTGTPRRAFGLDVVQSTGGRTGGGVTYDIRTGAGAYY